MSKISNNRGPYVVVVILVVVTFTVSRNNTQLASVVQYIDLSTATAQITGTSTTTGGSNAAPGRSGLELVRTSVEKMRGIKRLHFEQRESVRDLLSPTEGDYVSTDKARGVIHSIDKGDIRWIRWGTLYYVQDPATQAYRTGGLGNPAKVFLDFDKLSDILQNLDDVTVVSEDQVDGIDIPQLNWYASNVEVCAFLTIVTAGYCPQDIYGVPIT